MQGNNMDFHLAEIELIMTKALEMFKLFRILKHKFAEKGLIKTHTESNLGRNKDSTSVTKISGVALEEIFNDGYERLVAEDFNEEKDFPQMY